MKKYLTEGTGTFFLVLFIFLTRNGNTPEWEPLVYGATLVALGAAGRQISGAHFNPAVSLAALMVGRLERVDVAYYWIAQIAGALLAALLGSFLVHCDGVIDITMRSPNGLCAFFAETLGAFLLSFAALMAGRSPASGSNYPLAIGTAAVAGALALGASAGGGFNPALALGLCLGGNLSWASLWPVVAGALLGSAAAASLFRILNDNADGGDTE